MHRNICSSCTVSVEHRVRAVAGRYIYHTPCHLRAQGIGKPSLELLSMIPGFQIEDADAGCCGQSGTYGFEVAKHDIAMAVAEPVFKDQRVST